MKAAVYESDITPPLGCYMTGYGRDRRAQTVYTKLHAKSLVLEQDGQYAVVISVDICEYPSEMPGIVTKRIQEYTGISPECVCIHSTHAHCGAPVTDNPNINCFADPEYKHVFFRLVADSAILAYQKLDDAKLSFAEAEVPGIARNRCSVLKNGTFKTFEVDPDKIDHPVTEPDNRVPVLFVEQNGKKIGALYAFGCHQDTMGRRPLDGYSGDYSAFISEHLKDTYGRDFVSIYVAAPSGDINTFNPYGKTDEEKSRKSEVIAKLIAPSIVALDGKDTEIDGKLSVVKEKVVLRKRMYDEDAFYKLLNQYAEAKSMFQLRNLLYYQCVEKDVPVDMYVQVITVGEFALYIYPGEMFSEYSIRVKENSPYKFNMVMENSNAYGGYVPMPELFVEGNKLYETAPAYDSYLEVNAGEILYDRIINIANKMKS